uniref:Uncharacterized protein n=1 Tax=Parascaris equorum TaxID=6256 RepID=A0A914RKC3_PAREQ
MKKEVQLRVRKKATQARAARRRRRNWICLHNRQSVMGNR